MSFITNVLTLLNWHLRRQRRIHTLGGDDTASESESDQEGSDQDDTSVPSVAGRLQPGKEFVCDGNVVSGPFDIEDKTDHPEFGLESVADRAADHEPQPTYGRSPMETQFLDYMHDHQNRPRVEAYPTAFQDGIVLTDGTPGGWIIANDGSYRDRRTMQ